jgi:hypothetical protein
MSSTPPLVRPSVFANAVYACQIKPNMKEYLNAILEVFASLPRSLSSSSYRSEMASQYHSAQQKE